MSNSTNKFSNTARPPFDHEALDEVLRGVDSEAQAARDLDNQRVSTILAMTALQDAAGRRAANRLTAASGLAVVVRVPGLDWIAPVERALRLLGPFGEVIARGGPPKKSEAVSDKVADRLAAGHNVAGIGVTPERDLPPVLVTAADLTIEIYPPRNSVIAAVIGLVVGRRPRSMPHALARELGFDAIVSCIRRGSTAGACVARLVALGRSGKSPQASPVDVPALDTLAGYGEAMTWSKSIVGSVQEWRAGLRSWDSIPERGIVLASAPGLGKTSLCASVAAAAGLPFHATSISQLFTGSAGYLGDVVRCLERVIVEATANGKAVLMIDELDGLPNRATVDNRNRDFWSPIIQQLLLMLDSAISGQASNLIIIGCTNHPEMLDAALIRSGRLNRVITIKPPDARAIEGILRTHLGGELATADLAPVALLAVGATGADVAAWVKAARAAAVTAGRAMKIADLMAQVCPADHTDALARLGGDADLLASFRSRIEVSGRMLARAAEGTAGVVAPAARNMARKGRDGRADALRMAEFRLTPLLDRVRRSLGHLTAREASIVSRRIGLEGYPVTPSFLAEELGVDVTKVERMIDRSFAKLEAFDGWPGLLREIAPEILPISSNDMAASSWFDGLGPKRLAGLVRIGSGAEASVASTTLGTIVGSAGQEEWDAMRRAAREVVAATLPEASPAQFLARLRAGIPAGSGSYERLLLRDIGWPDRPRANWLLVMKGRLTPHALERRALVRARGPLGTVAVAASIGGAGEGYDGKPEKTPDAQAWEPDAATLAKVRKACERCLRAYGPDIVPTTFREFLPAIKDDPALAGIRFDVAVAAAATVGSPTVTVSQTGEIVVRRKPLRRDADVADEVAFKP